MGSETPDIATNGNSRVQNGFLLIREIRDYSEIGIQLSLQRQLIFGAALLLEAFYYSKTLALITLAMVVSTEILDQFIFRSARTMKARDIRSARKYLALIYFSSVCSAGTICFYAISISFMQGHGTHFMPLFFLFAAALFAAMNNHQILSVLVLRLTIYGITFLFIPLWDIWATNAPMKSEEWLQFLTSVFVLFFIIDCSRVFLNLYRTNLRQLDSLTQERDKATLANKTKSEFLATVSHELRTPLTSIKGSLDLINSGMLGAIPAKQENVLRIAQRNAGTLHKLINELLELQTIEAGRMTYKFAPVNIPDLIEQIAISSTPYAEQFGVGINYPAVGEKIVVQGDRDRLEQVLSNLISNAAKFSHQGGSIDIAIEADEKKVRISVADSGVGLSEKDKRKVFDRFTQLDSSDQRKVGGTGLGMNISKRIIDAHGGQIDYFKNPGQGTTFYIVLDRL